VKDADAIRGSFGWSYLAKLVQTSFSGVNVLGPFLDQAKTVLQRFTMVFQPGIELKNT